MTNVIATFANVPVPDLDAAIPLYQRIAGVDSVRRFPFEHLQVATVGPFLLIEGDLEGNMADQVATVLVRSIDHVIAEVLAAGGEVLDGPHQVSNGNGTRIITRHPDGVIFEFMQPSQVSSTRES